MIVASIDLMNGNAVQLEQGNKKILENENPIQLAKDFNKYGEIAVIDLDAAMNKGNNLDTIKEIIKYSNCRVGGGIRTIEKAKEIFSLGADKIIIGTSAFKKNDNEKYSINHDFLKELVLKIGSENIIIAVDSYQGEIVTHGWKNKSGLNVFETISELDKYCSEYLFTCVEKEGLMQGTDYSSIEKIVKLTKNKMTVAGGISSYQEIEKLSNLGVDIQLGMALYKGEIELSEAFVRGLNWKNDLIPTITKDHRGQILMLAYSNKESILKTMKENTVTYFSRSRNQLWTKGETSSNTQEFLEARVDCDKDTIIYTVKQKGFACHTGSYSCFGSKTFDFNSLYEIIKDRIENPIEGSYTAKLDKKLLREKIMEEAEEVCEANTKEEIIWEAADVIYFLSVLLVKNDVSFKEVLMELQRRRRK